MQSFTPKWSANKFKSILQGIDRYLKEYDEIYNDEIGFFYDLIIAIKETELFKEFFLDMLNLMEVFYSHEEMDIDEVFIKFIECVIGSNSLETNFEDVLRSLEKMPKYYKKKATSNLIELMKGTDLLKEYFPNFA